MSKGDTSDEPPRIQYLNTDLDLVASRDFTLLTDALAARGIRALYAPERGGDGQWYTIMEIDSEAHEPEVAIRIMLDAIEAIDDEAKKLWAECSKREFNIGYDCGDEPWGFTSGLSNSTLQRIARAGATLGITLYPYRPPQTVGAVETE